MAVNKKIGEALTEYFKSKGFGQHDIAAALGVSQQYVSNILSGNLMGRRAANKWENVFGIKAEWLLTGQGPMLLNEASYYDEEPTNLNIPHQGPVPNTHLLDLIASQQRTIEIQAETIKNLTSKNM